MARTIWQVMEERARDVDCFVAVSHYYSQVMQAKMNISADKMRVIWLGIDLKPYENINRSSVSENSSYPSMTIGFHSRLAASLGLETLVDAYLILKADPKFSRLRLYAAGGSTPDDRSFIKHLNQKFVRHSCADSVFLNSTFDHARRHEFYQNIDVLSVPVPGGEAFGSYLMEAMAAGVPVVQPQAGAFPELVDATQGGFVYSPNTPEELAKTLTAALSQPAQLKIIGQRGRQAVHKNFSVTRMASQMAELYSQLQCSRENVVAR
jgi:glycosyltransferase involved in cell wall biosynthesis